MIRNSALIALVSALAAASISGCATDPALNESSNIKNQDADKFGNVSMRLTIDGVNIDTLVYSIALASAPGVEVAGGTADVSSDGATATASAELLPGAYVVTLTTPDDSTCLGTGSFSITENAATNVALSMTCGTGNAPQTGNVDIELTDIETLPSCAVTEAFAAPLRTSGNVTLNAEATAGATFAWTVVPSNAGTFTSSTAASTAFNCDAEVDATITVTITDGSCTDTASFAIECLGVAVGPVCGNGVDEAGEDCTTCPADQPAGSCVVPPVCGNGVDEAGEDCTTCPQDQPAGSCVLPPECGNGVDEAGEDCTTCPEDQAAGSCNVCGDGVVGGTEQCDDGNDVDTDLCSNLCVLNPVDTDECGECIAEGAADIADFNENGDGTNPGCEATAECPELRTCVADSGCYGPQFGSHVCYCGINPATNQPYDLSVCIAPSFTPVGVCADEFIAGLPGVTGNQARLEAQFNPAYATGNAFLVLSASRDVNQCIAECGL